MASRPSSTVLLDWPEIGAQRLSEAEFQARLRDKGSAHGRRWILRIFNVSSPFNLAWVALGLGGQLVFAGRNDRPMAGVRETPPVGRPPPPFWYMSLGGGICLTAYFLWRHDLVGVLGQAMGLVVYVRNIA